MSAYASPGDCLKASVAPNNAAELTTAADVRIL